MTSKHHKRVPRQSGRATTFEDRRTKRERTRASKNSRIIREFTPEQPPKRTS